jgi:predicted thioredoxin/glutaredoxin
MELNPYKAIKRLEKELHEKTIQYNISMAVRAQLQAKNAKQKTIIKDQHLKICKLISEKWISQDKSNQSGR